VFVNGREAVIQLKLHKGPSANCPSCGATGKPVKTDTVRSLIRRERLGDIDETEGGYFFCGTPECETVYFTEDGRAFLKGDLSVRVGIKETSAPRPICYCFGHSMEGIAGEIRLTGKSEAAQDIRARMKKEGCSCETKNPRGSCCLKTVEDYIAAELQKKR
jgi:Zinc binding domain